MSNFIRDVAESAPIREVVERYTDQGIKRNTFLCPFHDDTHPSASFKRDNRWTCYVCNASGDSVDFVAKLFGLRPIDAAKKLNDDFGLGIADEKKSSDAIRIAEEKRAKRARRKAALQEKNKKLSRRHRAYIYAINHFAPQTPADMDDLDPRYVEAVKNIDALAWQIETLPRR